jgi:predicted enzyme related to lactoylglutathione lyase
LKVIEDEDDGSCIGRGGVRPEEQYWQPTGGMTMLKKVIYVALFVSDQDKALDYYTKVVGLEKRWDAPLSGGTRWVTVGVKGQDFELVLWPGTPTSANPIDGGFIPATYTIETEDCRKAFEALKARGVKFEPPEVLEQRWGLAAMFQDPDGNRLQLRQGNV